MERIKQAIEDAKLPDAAGDSMFNQPYPANKHIKQVRLTRTPYELRIDMVIKVSALVLIFLMGWAWLRMDFMNQLELRSSQQIHEEIKQARAEAKKRTLEEEKFKLMLFVNLEYCQSSAERAKNDYVKLMQDTVRINNRKTLPGKQESFFVPREVAVEATNMLATARAECQQIYDTQLRNGK